MDDNPLARLAEFGQSVWCDEISIDLLLGGGLKSLIERDGVSGVTSNPTIFQKAISGSDSYDRSIKELASKGSPAREIMEALIVDDIRMAADQLKPVYDATHTRDGWVSIEVAPSLAYDTQGSIAEAMRLKATVDRPNVFVKVPATEQGVEAVRELTARGYSINVTLIFSNDRYREIMEAYLSGLEALQAKRARGEMLPALDQVHSVASFFVSRVDTLVDKELGELIGNTQESGEDVSSLRELRGKAAVANAKQAYRLFRQTFSGERWHALRADGARLQRPLWASTSTKNPAYSDILYVQELIGPDTVNTMPIKTMDAFRDHGEPAETVTAGMDEAAAQLDELEEAGIHIAEVTAQLEREGIETFAHSFDALLEAVEQKRANLVRESIQAGAS